MITILGTLRTTNDGTTRQAAVTATSGATGGNEGFVFNVGGEVIPKTELFGPNDTKTVTVEHHQTGVKPVSVTASGKTEQCVLNLDAPSSQC